MEYVSTLDLCEEWASNHSDEDEDTTHAEEEPAGQRNVAKPDAPTTDGDQQPVVARPTATPSSSSSTTSVVSSSAAKPIAPELNGGVTAAAASPNDDQRTPAAPSEKTAAAAAATPTTTTNAKPPPPPPYMPPKPSDRDEDIYGQEIRSGQNFNKYAAIAVRVTGDNVPPPIMDDFTAPSAGEHLHADLLRNVRKSGYTLATPIQRYGIGAVLAGRDVVGCAQTGSGKTAAFLLGILQRLLVEEPRPMGAGRPQALVLTPTRELALQLFLEARKFANGTALRSAVLYGGTSTGPMLMQLRKGCHVLVATPGRLHDFIDNGWVSLSHVRFLVLDEADRMLDMGFLPEVQRLTENPDLVAPDKRQTLMFSATFPDEIQELAGRMLNAYIFIAVGIVGGACADVVQTVRLVRYHDKRERLLEMLELRDEDDAEGCGRGGIAMSDDYNGGGIMVFVETRRQADFLAGFLAEAGLGEHVTSIHGDRYQEQREKALADFKAQRVRVLIGTSVAARGLNIPNVQHVINYDMPKSIDDYVHRIGRTGRIGNKGRATTFFDPEMDSVLAGDLVRILDQADQAVPEFLSKLAQHSGGASEKCRNVFGGLDMRTGRFRKRTHEPTAHEPLEQW